MLRLYLLPSGVWVSYGVATLLGYDPAKMTVMTYLLPSSLN